MALWNRLGCVSSLHHPVHCDLSGSGRLPIVRSRVMVGSGAHVRAARPVARVVMDVKKVARLMVLLLQEHIGRAEVNQ